MASLIVGGTVRVPGDKSISHRSLICAALATGTSRIRAILESADVHSTASVLRGLGVDVPTLGPSIAVRGVGLRGLREAASSLDCGNSGTTTRLMAGVVAGHPFTSRFTGDASLSKRPMRRVAQPLSAMGATVELTDGERLPMAIRGGTLHSITWSSDRASAQVKSAILLAGLVGGVDVTVTEPERSRDHTERMLRALGAHLEVNGRTVRLGVGGPLATLDAEVPGDPSSAAFFGGLAALADGGEIDLPNVCLNPTRTGFFAVLRRMGASVKVADETERHGEQVGTLRVAPGSLRAVNVVADEVPSMIDELPLVACLAARAEGETVISGAAELRVKESDRIAAVVANLRALGVEAEELPDGMRVRGSTRPMVGQVTSRGDHRIAMAFGILGVLPNSRIAIDDTECVAVSFPGFWQQLADVTRASRVR